MSEQDISPLPASPFADAGTLRCLFIAVAVVLFNTVARAPATNLARAQPETLVPPAAGEALSARVHDARVQRAVDLIYNLRLPEAEHFFAAIKTSHPAHPLGHFFFAMVQWWRVLIDLDDDSEDKEFYRRLEVCIAVCDARLKRTPDDFDAILFKGGAIGFRGRLRGDRRQMLRAARDGMRSLPLLKRSRSLEPTNKDILFGQGIYNYFREVIPQKYPIVKAVTWLLESGDREVGLQQLREVAREGSYARAEALYFLAQVHRLFEEDDAGALPYLQQLRALYPANSIFHRYTALTYAKLGRWESAIPLYREVVERSLSGQTGYHRRGHIEAEYYQGRNAFLMARLQTAIHHFTAADSLSRGLGARPKDQEVRGYVALANLYLGMALDALGRRPEAVLRYRRVRLLPSHGASHKLARRYEREAYRLPD